MKEQILYYEKRANEYDAVYLKPERQEDLRQLKNLLVAEFADLNLVEIACGTGYWTKILAQKAKSIIASDINEAVLKIANQRAYGSCEVHFSQVDMNALVLQKDEFEGLFGGFIWSHILKEELTGFLERCLAQIAIGGKLIFIDNKYVKGSSTPIHRTDEKGNTFQKRKLQSGSTFEVIKNFPTSTEVKRTVEGLGHQFEWIDLPYYWMIKITKLG